MRKGELKISVVVGLVVALTLALTPHALAAKAHTTLEVVGSGDSHTVKFAVCPRKAETVDGLGASSSCPSELSESDTPMVAGDTTLLVRLNVKKDPQLTARYIPDSDAATKLLCGDEERIFLEGKAPKENCTFTPQAIADTNSTSLKLGFRLPAGVPVSSIAGKLVLGLDGKDEDKPIPIEGAPRELEGVAVAPDELVLDSDNSSAKVTLIGPDVVELLRTFALGKGTVTLRDDAGDTATAKVEFQSARTVETSSNPNFTKGTVTLEGDPSPGKYTGKLALSHAVADGPSIEIELRSHESIWLLVGVVLLGIVAVGLAGRLVAMATRRSILLEALDQSVDAYLCVFRPGETKSWKLSDLLGVSGEKSDHDALHAMETKGGAEDDGEKHRIGFSPSDYKGVRLQGLPALRKSIAEARSSRDLDEDATRTLDMVGRIQRWLRVEPAARLLVNVERKDRPEALLTRVERKEGEKKKKESKKESRKWEASQTWLGTQALLKMARREPADAGKADDLVARLLDQAKWHHLFAWAWESAKPGSGLEGELIALDDLVKEEKTAIGARTQETRDLLVARLRSLIRTHMPDSKPPLLPVPEKPADCPARLGITDVDWQASPNIFTGWATLDAPSYGQLARRLATSSKTVYRRKGFGKALVMEAKTLRPVDFAWTGAILGMTSLSYGVTNYSHTWGTCEDLAKAFLAGALGTAAVKWGALPIFRSARIRGTTKAS